MHFVIYSIFVIFVNSKSIFHENSREKRDLDNVNINIETAYSSKWDVKNVRNKKNNDWKFPKNLMLFQEKCSKIFFQKFSNVFIFLKFFFDKQTVFFRKKNKIFAIFPQIKKHGTLTRNWILKKI